jgi:hypothetical protein
MKRRNVTPFLMLLGLLLFEAELSERIERCDRLKKRLAGEDESTRKVYLRRIQMCQDLYRYVLQSKGTDR